MVVAVWEYEVANCWGSYLHDWAALFRDPHCPPLCEEGPIKGGLDIAHLNPDICQETAPGRSSLMRSKPEK